MLVPKLHWAACCQYKQSQCPHILNRTFVPMLQGYLDFTRLALVVMTATQAAYIVAIFAFLYAAQAATLIQQVISINGTYQQTAALPAVCVLVGSSSCWAFHVVSLFRVANTCCVDVSMIFCIHFSGLLRARLKQSETFACLSHVVPLALISAILRMCNDCLMQYTDAQYAVHAYRPQPKRSGSSRQIHLGFTTMSEYR